MMSSPAFCEPAASDEDARKAFLDLLNRETEIATKTKMNADYVPGIVTVLYGADLETRGFRTVWEALSLVPGVEPGIEQTGRRKLTVRGTGNVFGSGNVKVLLNGISQNATEHGLADPVFSIPVAQVDRIEMIRGPGSVVHGEYAYAGVINVITHREENRAYAFAGSFDNQGAGANLDWQNKRGDLKLSLSLSGWRSDGASPEVEQDAAHAFAIHYPGYGLSASDSYAPGRANTAQEAGTAVFDLEADDFSLAALWTESAMGDHFGVNEFLPPSTDEDHLADRTRNRSLEARQRFTFGPDTEGTLILGWQDVTRTRRNLYVAPPAIAPGAIGPVFLNSDYREGRQWIEWDQIWRGLSRHEILALASLASIQVLDYKNTLSNFNHPSLPTLTGTERLLQSVALQDHFRQSDMFSLTFGLRYDDYSDVDTRVTPRVSGVWRLDGGHIVKAQYAEAFRPVTFLEALDGLEATEPSTVRTYELGYIRAALWGETRVTAFYSSYDGSVLQSPSQFTNIGIIAQGFELEHIRRIGHWHFDGNISYVETEQDDTHASVERTPKWLANAAIVYEPSHGTSLALQGHYVSGFSRNPSDPRSSPNANGYTTADLTVSFGRDSARGAGLRIGVKNLFDADVRYPTMFQMPDDYPQPGRTWWTQVSWNF